MKWGKHIKALEARYKSTGVQAKPLRERPRLKREDWRYLEAFETVAASRQVGMAGACPVTLQDILAYLEIFRVEEAHQRAKFTRLIQAMDGAYLEHQASEQAKASKK